MKPALLPLLLLLVSALPAAAQTLTIPRSVRWDTLQTGLAVSEFTVEAGRAGFDVRIIVARIEPQHFDFQLVHSTRANRMTGNWSVDVAPAAAAFAINAGQFKETGPWGWVVIDGRELRDPGTGPLSLGIAFDTAGALRWIPYAALRGARRDRSIVHAFQSYPTLLFDRRVPRLVTNSRMVDQNHRDARLILAADSMGNLLIVLTRYDALGGTMARVPIGLTVPESIEVVRALGARHAVMLDGGVSAQMLVRGQDGTARVWKGLRQVPLALIALPRAH